MNFMATKKKGGKKRGQMNALVGGALSFAVVAIVILVVFLVIEKGQEQTTVGSAAYNGIGQVQEGASTLVSFLPLIAIALAGGIVIFLIIRYFSKGMGGGGV